MTDPDLYGSCTAVPCNCLRTRWKGTACPNWKPFTPDMTPEQIRELLEQVTEKHEKTH